CLGLFTVASFFCGTAHSLPELVFFRILQGMGAGALQPTEQAILRETWPVEKQGMAMGLYGLAVMIGPAIGPTLGGWITDNYNWPWIFYINIPIGIGGLWMVNRFVHDPPYMRGGEKPKVDALGIILLTVGLASLQAVLEEGQMHAWFSSGLIVGLTVVAVISLGLLIWRELLIGTGLGIAGLGRSVVARFTLGASVTGVLWPRGVRGIGFVLIFVARSTATLAGVERRKLTSGAGSYSRVRELGGSFGTAISA